MSMRVVGGTGGDPAGTSARSSGGVPSTFRPASHLVVADRREVLAAVDDSAGGYLAVEQAAREAGWRGWPLRVVHVTEPRPSRGPVEPAAAELLDDVVVRARALTGVPVVGAIRAGPVTGELVAASRGAGLVVLGARGADRPGTGLAAGSVARHVAVHAGAPVLLLRVPPRPAAAVVGVGPIVVGVDGSPGSDSAFEFAVAEARLRGASVLAVHATAPDRRGDPLHAGALGGFGASCLGIPVARNAVPGDPRQVLARVSAEAGAVVVGARGTGGGTGRPAGSVVDALIRTARSPLFVVHPTDSGAFR